MRSKELGKRRRDSRTLPSHVRGIKQGNATGNYEKPGRPQAGRDVDRRALDRHQRRGPRADRPEHAEPLAGLVAVRGNRRCRRRAGIRASRGRRAACEHAAAPDAALRAADRERERRADPLRAARRADADRGPPARLRRGGARAAAGPVRDARALGHDAADAAVDAARRWSCRRSAAARSSELPVPCSYDLEVDGVARTSSALRRRRGAARVPVQRHRLLHGRRRALQADADLLGERGAATALPVRVWRETMERHFPGSAWLRLSRESFDRLRGVQGAPRAAELGRGRRALLAGGVAVDRDPVRAIADAVLYEGYVLWPYRRSALKNQRRWTFGGVYPAARGERIRTIRA